MFVLVSCILRSNGTQWPENKRGSANKPTSQQKHKLSAGYGTCNTQMIYSHEAPAAYMPEVVCAQAKIKVGLILIKVLVRYFGLPNFFERNAHFGRHINLGDRKSLFDSEDIHFLMVS
ncbi:hypothetical protein ILYODFUR_027898 [Ilyodon furcidens]|uniref:Uncharacterized protein n=1 Tax=Ilyodon furcidens TaxID=33524 RepID=A0ABV0T263_9TELE